jgi:[acyl-carrier-protein] S-malonyltransferase
MFNIAHRILGYDLYSKCTHGPIEDLNQTLYAQPAIYVTSLAAVQKLKSENQKAVENCVVTAGFSVGEITALVFAGCMTYEDGLRLIKARAEAMQSASNEVNSGMMSVFIGRETKLTLAIEAAREWCHKYMKIDVPCIQIANHMYAECKVLAGHKEVSLLFSFFLDECVMKIGFTIYCS